MLPGSSSPATASTSVCDEAAGAPRRWTRRSSCGPDSPRELAGQDFERVFMEEIAELWRTRPFPAPGEGELDPSIRGQLSAYATATGLTLPVEVIHVFLSCWIRLYGLLCMEVLGQLDFAYSDLEPVFEECLREMAPRLGLDYDAATGRDA